MADDGEVGLGRTRSRRVLPNKTAKSAALERLRSLKGQKNKYEVSEMQNVYDVVDEKEYSKTVLNRQKDDWIIDDGTGEYVDDGREIFDDDMDDEEAAAREKKRKSRMNKKDKETAKVVKQVNQANFHSVRDMLSNMPVKRKRSDAPSTSAAAVVNEDELMSDLMQELKNEKKSTSNAQIFKKLMSKPMDYMPAVKLKPQLMPSVKPELKKFKPCTTYESSGPSIAPVVYDVDDPAPYPANDNNFEDDFGTDDFGVFDEPMDTDAVVAVQPSNGVHDATNKPVIIKVEPEDESSVKVNGSCSSIPALTKVKTEPGHTKLDMVGDISDFMGEDREESNGMTDTEALTPPSMEGESGGLKTLNFYWLDMYEDPKSPGYLYLFGKVRNDKQGGFSSCCIIVHNLYRKVYLLPRDEKIDGEQITLLHVYNEFNEKIAPKYRIKTFRSKQLPKKYCFDLEDVPETADYLEVMYSMIPIQGKCPPLPQDLTGDSFSRVLGSTNPLMEIFLLDKGLKGPGWLQVTQYELVPTEKQQTWSRFEFTCDVSLLKVHPNSAELPLPPLTLVSLNIQAVHDATKKKDSIIFAGVAINKNFQLLKPLPPAGVYQDFFCLLNKPPGEIWPLDADRVFNKRTTKMDSERSMLGCLLAKLQQLDPDLYVGHDLNLELFITQLMQLKVPNWSRLGRLRRTAPATRSNKTIDFRAALAGRLLCDVKISAMELIRARSYDLPSLGAQVLGMKEDEIGTLTGHEMRQLFDSSEGLRGLIRWGMQHCVLNIRLINELQVMPLATQITAIAGNTLSRTLLGGRSERNEYLLLHAFNAKNYIVPDKFRPFQKKMKSEPGEETDEKTGTSDKKDGSDSGPSYSGGLVLTPKRGFYDDFIVLMDFNSLYPSIIQEYNVCFTTGVGAISEDSETFDSESASTKSKGVLPEEIRKLVESRKHVKNLMKASGVSVDQWKQYDIRQKALKLTANSMYGCLGFRMSRFYAKHLASYITGKGRDILLKTKDAVEKMGFEVIYGDTDSLMINSHTQNLKHALEIGSKIKAEINRTYKLLELEIDGIFRFLLLLKKKKYAALVCNPKLNGEHEYVMELKGLDIVRRDWAPIGANTAKACLNEIMSEQPLDDKVMKVCDILNAVAKRLRNSEVPVKDLLITKQLAKHPEEYKDAAGLYHVHVALRMNNSGKLPKKFRNGDTVSYLFCTDGQPHHLCELDEPVEVKKETVSEDGEKQEVVEKKPLIPDAEYYLANQVHPVVSRICEPIPGLDPARVADALGIDSKAYKRRNYGNDDRDDKFLGRQSEAERYTNCEKFITNCVHCGTKIEWFSALINKKGKWEFNIATCPNIDCNQPPYDNENKLKNQLHRFMRKFTRKYYEGVLTCEDPSCSNTTTGVSFALQNGLPVCACKQALMYVDYTAEQLYRQLNYVNYIFNLQKALESLKKEDQDFIKRELYNLRCGKNEPGVVERAYENLKAFVNNFLSASSYNEVDLSKVCNLEYLMRCLNTKSRSNNQRSL